MSALTSMIISSEALDTQDNEYVTTVSIAHHALLCLCRGFSRKCNTYVRCSYTRFIWGAYQRPETDNVSKGHFQPRATSHVISSTRKHLRGKFNAFTSPISGVLLQAFELCRERQMRPSFAIPLYSFDQTNSFLIA